KSKEERDIKINIIPEFATELLTIINTLNDMKQEKVEWISGNYPIGVIVSDTLMFQRAEPYPSHPNLNCFYGVATPLIKNSIPLKIIQMEHLLTYQPLKNIKILLLTYEGQKPLNKEYHNIIRDWVINGGSLLIIDDNSDRYNELNNWWKNEGYNSPLEHLIKTLWGDKEPDEDMTQVGKGYVRWIKRSPSILSLDNEGAEHLLNWVKELSNKSGINVDYKNYIHLKRGPYHICSVLDESVSDLPYKISGKFINLFNPELKVEEDVLLYPSNRALLLDINSLQSKKRVPSIIASAGRIRSQKVGGNRFHFTVRGPSGIPGKVVIFYEKQPQKIVTSDMTEFQQYYDSKNHLLYIDFTHQGKNIHFEIDL
ncbi:MAG: hypothetical protein ACP5KS_09115, partial [Candidatus Hydrogenedens sp.]